VRVLESLLVALACQFQSVREFLLGFLRLLGKDGRLDLIDQRASAALTQSTATYIA
jgi:hypothetical protein